MSLFEIRVAFFYSPCIYTQNIYTQIYIFTFVCLEISCLLTILSKPVIVCISIRISILLAVENVGLGYRTKVQGKNSAK